MCEKLVRFTSGGEGFIVQTYSNPHSGSEKESAFCCISYQGCPEIFLMKRVVGFSVRKSNKVYAYILSPKLAGSFRCECLLSAVGRCGTTEGEGPVLSLGRLHRLGRI